MKINSLSNKLLFLIYVINIIMYANNSTYFFTEKYIFVINVVGLVIILCLTSIKNSRLRLSINAMSILIFFLFFLGYIGITFFKRSTLEGIVPFIYSLLFYFTISNMKINEKFLKGIYLAILIIFSSWLLKVDHYYDYFMTQLYDYKNPYVINSNLLGMIIMLFTILICAMMEKFGRNKIEQLFFCILGLWGIWNAATRGTFVALLFFVLINFAIPKEILKKKRVMIGGYIIICIIGITFPILYTKLGMKATESISFLNGKDIFSGRELIWNEFFEIIDKNILKLLVGIGELKVDNLLYLSVDGNSLHNWFLKMIFSFGILGLIFYLILIIYNLNCIYSKTVSNAQVILLVGFMAILINSFFENLIGSYVLTSFVYLILALANNPVMQINKKE